MRRKKNPLVTILVTLAVAVTLIAGGLTAFIIYQNTHVFVENKAYPIRAQSLDLREEDISFAHYDSLHSLLPDCQILWNVPFQGGRYPAIPPGLPFKIPAAMTFGFCRIIFPT